MISNPAMKNNAVAIACNPPSWASIINGTMKKAKRLLFMAATIWGDFSRKTLFCAPSFVNSSIQSSWHHSKSLRPLGDGQCFAVEGKVSINSHISMLLGFCRPAAIIRFVVSIIVYAIDSIADCWPIAHISKKVFKSLPSFADRNPPGAVVFEPGTRWSVASSHDPAPSRVHIILRSAVRSIVNLGSFSGLFGEIASAGLRLPLSKRLPVCGSFLPAVTRAEPKWIVAGFVGGPSKNDQATESEPGKINQFCHKFVYGANKGVCQ